MQTKMRAVGLIILVPLASGGLAAAIEPLFSPSSAIAAPRQKGTAPGSDVCRWERLGWGALSEEEQQAWKTLGWTPETWDADGTAPSEAKDWSELSPSELGAAKQLGFEQGTWDANLCANH